MGAYVACRFGPVLERRESRVDVHMIYCLEEGRGSPAKRRRRRQTLAKPNDTRDTSREKITLPGRNRLGTSCTETASMMEYM